MTALAGRVDEALASVSADERAALERRERGGAGYADIAAELGVRREQVADLLVAARLEIAFAVDGSLIPERVTPQCGPARRVIAAQHDAEAVSARDLDRAGAHVEGCPECQAARRGLQAGRLACRAWSDAPPAATPASRPAAAGVAAARGRGRIVAVVVAVLLAIVGAAAVFGSDDDATVPAPAAPPVGEGSADAASEREDIPPPGDEFCAPGEKGC